MLKDQDKYQNLVSQIHDLNRQNLLNENEKIEQLTDKIDKLEKNPNKSEIKKEEIKQEDNVLSLNKEVLVNNEENYEEIKPLIRKGTIYTCKDDTNIYEIPYTIEIKGKLYANRFLFILQKDSTTKDCIIKKEHM